MKNVNIARRNFVLSSSELDDILEGLEELFGDHEVFKVTATAEMSTADVKIGPDATRFYIRNSFAILNPLASDAAPLVEMSVDQEMYAKVLAQTPHDMITVSSPTAQGKVNGSPRVYFHCESLDDERTRQ